MSVCVGAVLAVAGSAVGSGALGGTPIAQASDGALSATATLVAPGSGAFSIWSVIYVGLLASAVVQALPGRAADPAHRRGGWWLVASMLLNAAWILAAQQGLLGLTVPVIAVLVAVVGRLALLLVAQRPQRRLDTAVLGATAGLYLGWVLVATVANVAAALATSSIDLSVLSPTAWAGVVVAVAAVIASLTSVRLSGLAWTGLGVAAASAWGLAGIAVGRATEGPSSSVTTVLAAVAATVVLAVGVVAGLRSEASRGRTGRSTGQQTGR
ncbi:tryptophan-rich sensory protein [Miniimonas arenae]|uniref:tryptophan-rich sensory protein n=1 Tax=Miniimonas arenae TaxID=676201 RepID=UPI0028AC4A55|nr:tryptophan-rich sensory protein [Miniimonas arenae]